MAFPTDADHQPFGSAGTMSRLFHGVLTPRGVGLGFAALMGATVLWLSLEAHETVSARRAAIPRLVIDITDVTGTAAAPTVASVPPAGNIAAPVPALLEQTKYGALPKIADSGQTSWQTYAHPFDPTDTRPRLAIVLTRMGLSSTQTESAIQALPSAVTLAFPSYVANLDQWAEKARMDGHEILLSVPMEPADYPLSDPGPNALLTSLDDNQNVERLETALGKTAGYIGIIGEMGSRFTTVSDAMQPVLGTLQKRGLLYVDPRATPRTTGTAIAGQMGLPYAEVGVVLDQEPTPAAIDAQLAKLEEMARKNGGAIAKAEAYPVVLERLALWARTLEARGLALAPVSAIAAQHSQKP